MVSEHTTAALLPATAYRCPVTDKADNVVTPLQTMNSGAVAHDDDILYWQWFKCPEPCCYVSGPDESAPFHALHIAYARSLIEEVTR